ncbi:MAG: 4-hydroxythreonine-4-phosphate dehydrogenase PdxA [Dysgonamonadaceae bacterium]|jgi:4-hydroxythreonine-4-phosphate dehydrogenase|nr:4-hydroxythreonine-4-phosphate dehydrogenase PdxA [Dysgonamonadaceae bacterium]
MNDKLIKIGITQGDINGVGYELILKTLEDVRILEFCIPVIYGSSKILAYHRKALDFSPININIVGNVRDIHVNRINLVNSVSDELMVELSRQTKEGAEAAETALRKAIADLKGGSIHALLTAPAIDDPETVIQSEVGEGKQTLKMLIYDNLRIALATGKIPLADVPASLSVNSLTEKIKLLHNTLIHDFIVTSPRIAVLSLNPGTEHKEQWGKEEQDVIAPALTAASEAGICCFGPYAADKLFASDDYRKFDAIMAMYYDQALIPFRSITSGEGVYYTAGLPVIATAPDQGVAYELAGKNLCPENSFRNALYLAADLTHNRMVDKEIYANPLRKQYFERGSDNEKLDLTKDEI